MFLEHCLIGDSAAEKRLEYQLHAFAKFVNLVSAQVGYFKQVVLVEVRAKGNRCVAVDSKYGTVQLSATLFPPNKLAQRPLDRSEPACLFIRRIPIDIHDCFGGSLIRQLLLFLTIGNRNLSPTDTTLRRGMRIAQNTEHHRRRNRHPALARYTRHPRR
jgi:hypothetical protein